MPTMFAQVAKPKAAPAPSRFDLYGGYGYLKPIDSGIAGHQYPSIINLNVTASATYFFSRHFGFEVQGSYFSDNTTHRNFQICTLDAKGVRRCQQDQNEESAMGGIQYRTQRGRFTPFAHALVGEQSQDGPVVNPGTVGVAFLGGVGIDYTFPFLGNHLAVRPIEADFQYGRLHYGPLVAPANLSGGTAGISDVKLSGGLVLKMGSMAPKLPVSLSCTATPSSFFAGDPVTLTASATGLSQKKKASYRWDASGGKVSMSAPDANTAMLETAGLAPGEYKVSGHVMQGQHPYQIADCMVPVTVRRFDPPTISCTANPSTGMAGADVTITSTAMSPQNRALTYAYTSSTGSVSGTGATVRLATAGQQPGTIQIGCTVTDDLGQTATAQTSMTLSGPTAPLAKVAAQTMCSVSFERDSRRPARVDNEAKACLDGVALSLNRDAQSTLVITGSSAQGEEPGLAAQRAMNAKRYLRDEKGIDAGRIQLRSKDGDSRGASLVLLPAGATADADGSMDVDEHSVKQHGEAYGKARRQ